MGAQGHVEGPAEGAEALPRGWMVGAAVRGAFPAQVWGTRSRGRRGVEGRCESPTGRQRPPRESAITGQQEGFRRAPCGLKGRDGPQRRARRSCHGSRPWGGSPHNDVFTGKQSVGKYTVCSLPALPPRQDGEESTGPPANYNFSSFHLEGAVMALWAGRARTETYLAEKQQHGEKKTVRANPIKASLTERR